MTSKITQLASLHAQTRVFLCVISCLILASCTISRSYLDVELDELIIGNGFTSVSLIQHSMTPGSIVSTKADDLIIICEWPTIFATPPTIRERQVELNKHQERALQLFARDQALIQSLSTLYRVKNVSVGPLILTTITSGSLPDHKQEVATRCLEKLTTTRRSSPLVVFAEGTLTADVIYSLEPKNQDMVALLEPMLTDWVSAFGNFVFDNQTKQISGRLVKAYRPSSDDVYATLMEPTTEDDNLVQAFQEPLTGIWVIEKWKSPYKGVPRVSGTLTVGPELEEGKYAGIISFFLEGKKSVIEEVVINVAEEVVTMEGTVIQGRDLWTDDSFQLKLKGTHFMRGTVSSSLEVGETKLTLIKSLGMQSSK